MVPTQYLRKPARANDRTVHCNAISRTVLVLCCVVVCGRCGVGGGVVGGEESKRDRKKKKKEKREKETGERGPPCAFKMSPCVPVTCPYVFWRQKTEEDRRQEIEEKRTGDRRQKRRGQKTGDRWRRENFGIFAIPSFSNDFVDEFHENPVVVATSCRILRSCSAWAARSSWWRIFSLHSAMSILRCSSNIVLICELELLRSSAILSSTDPPSLTDHSFGLSDERKLTLSTFQVSDVTRKLIIVASYLNGLPVLSTATARNSASLSSSTSGTLVTSVLEVYIAGGREVPLIGVCELPVFGLITCVGCDIVQVDHAPEVGVAQRIFHGILVRHQVKHQEEVEEGLKEEVERRVKREHSSNQTQVRMHGWHGMTHRARLEPQVRCMNACTTTHRRASCSVVRSCHVRVGHGVHAIVRNVLKVVQVVREDVRSLP